VTDTDPQSEGRPEPLPRFFTEAVDLWRSWASGWPHPIFGLAEPAPWPRWVSSIDGNGWLLVLTFGDPDPDGPGGSVVSIHHNVKGHSPRIERLLGIKWRAPSPPLELSSEQGEMLINRTSAPATLWRHEESVVARCLYEQITVTVAAHLWDRWPLELLSVEDVTPFVRGREEYMLDWYRRHDQLPPSGT
jgi:hypothetical protein